MVPETSNETSVIQRSRSAVGVDARSGVLDVEIVVPVYNEAQHLADRIRELRQYLDQSFPFQALVTVVDNASTDSTFAIAEELAASMPGVSAVHLDMKGRGLALRHAWSASSATVVAYMDVDLSTSLEALLPLVTPLLSGHRDVAIGTRLGKGARVVRGSERELISRIYNRLVMLLLHGQFSDAQCGFKALRREVALELLPLVKDNEWFFDTELLITAQHLGMRLSEVPVDWVDDPDSRVHVFSTAVADLRGIWRVSHGPDRALTREHARGREGASLQVTSDQLLRFAGVGLISTLGYLALFVALGPSIGYLISNAIDLAICTLLNTLLHRELATHIGGSAPVGRFVAVGVELYLISLGITSLAVIASHLLFLSALVPMVLAVCAANAVAAVLRFAVLRSWIFRPQVPEWA